MTPASALRDAIRTRDQGAVRQALQQGACPHSADACGLTPVHHAILHLNPCALIELCRQGASLTQPGPDGRTGEDWLNAVPANLDARLDRRWLRTRQVWLNWCPAALRPSLQPA